MGGGVAGGTALAVDEVGPGADLVVDGAFVVATLAAVELVDVVVDAAAVVTAVVVEVALAVSSRVLVGGAVNG